MTITVKRLFLFHNYIMKPIKTLFPLVLALNLIGCASQQPVFTFSLVGVKDTNPTIYKLKRHPTSAITADADQVVRLWMDNAYFTQLYDKKAIKEGYSGKREVLIYAILYKDGVFQKFSKITDLANNMASYQPVVVQKPNFFTETMDGSSYEIVIKAYEVDTEGLVRILRRVNTTDVSKVASGTSPYAPGATFAGGFQDVLHGVFDMILSVTGKSVDDWVEQIAADKVFEHSIYVVPAYKENNERINRIVLLASGDDGDEAQKLWTWNNSFNGKSCNSLLDNKVVEEIPFTEKDCLKSADFLEAKNTKLSMRNVENLDLSASDLKSFDNGSLGSYSPVPDNDSKSAQSKKIEDDLNFVSHISISIERLSTPPENK